VNLMSYKGYRAQVEYDAEDEVLVGRVLGVNDVIGFHAESVDALKAAFQEAVDDYVATCERIGKAPEREFSGRMMFRVAPKVHADASLAAQLAGKSLNQWAEEALEEAAGKILERTAGHGP
jgi:predicted HicB family RNase H-like nuclease